jgi:hypothetical protein
LGAYNQIEIYPKLEANNIVGFVNRVKELLYLTTNTSEERIEFVESIKFVSQENEYYCQYKQTKLIFVSPYENQLEWNIDLFNWSNQEQAFEIRLGVSSESLLYGEYPNICYSEDLIEQIEFLMLQINGQKENEILLFTDEASEGNFITELEGKLSSVNYLFDIAIIPAEIKWNMNENKYEILDKFSEQIKYRSKDNYMKLMKKESN